MTTTAPADTAPNSNPLRLAAGKYYRARNGEKIGPMLSRNDYFTTGQPQPGFTLWYPDRTLIAEWAEPTPSPVRTIAIQRTEIRPGVYGRVRVYNPLDNDIVIQLVDREGMGLANAVVTATELRTIAATLTELAEGLDKIAAERTVKW